MIWQALKNAWKRLSEKWKKPARYRRQLKKLQSVTRECLKSLRPYESFHEAIKANSKEGMARLLRRILSDSSGPQS